MSLGWFHCSQANGQQILLTKKHSVKEVTSYCNEPIWATNFCHGLPQVLTSPHDWLFQSPCPRNVRKTLMFFSWHISWNIHADNNHNNFFFSVPESENSPLEAWPLQGFSLWQSQAWRSTNGLRMHPWTLQTLLPCRISTDFSMQFFLHWQQRQNTNLQTCAYSENSDQPAHLCSPIIIFTGRILIAKDVKVHHVNHGDSDERMFRCIWEGMFSHGVVQNVYEIKKKMKSTGNVYHIISANTNLIGKLPLFIATYIDSNFELLK